MTPSEIDELAQEEQRREMGDSWMQTSWEVASGWVQDRLRVAALNRALRERDAKNERLRAWKAETMEVMAGFQDVGNALGVPLGHRITARAAVDKALDLRNQRDEARAGLAEMPERIAQAIEADAAGVVKPSHYESALRRAARIARAAKDSE